MNKKTLEAGKSTPLVVIQGRKAGKCQGKHAVANGNKASKYLFLEFEKRPQSLPFLNLLFMFNSFCKQKE